MPDETKRFAADLAIKIRATTPIPLVGVYLHGSAVLGDFRPTSSDLDVLLLIRDRTSRRDLEQMARVLASSDRCPGVGLEATVVEESMAAVPAAPWPYRVHVTTERAHLRTILCDPGRGDSDLILHYAVVRESGWAAHGPPPTEVIGPVAGHVVTRQLAAELRWAVDNASESYTVLNACRALHFSVQKVLSSKTAGGMWALERGIEPELVAGALQARECDRHAKAGQEAAEFALGVADSLDQTR